jgi:uncharacterized coiled-coil DUF342 family protein
VEEHRRIVSESQAIKDDLSKQLIFLTSSIESLNSQRTELSERVSQAQAAGLEMRRNIEQAHRDLSDFTETGAVHSQELASIRKIVNELRTQTKKKP